MDTGKNDRTKMRNRKIYNNMGYVYIFLLFRDLILLGKVEKIALLL